MTWDEWHEKPHNQSVIDNKSLSKISFSRLTFVVCGVQRDNRLHSLLGRYIFIYFFQNGEIKR